MLEERLSDPARLASMASGMRASARPSAAADLAAWALELAGPSS
jgi:UDP-N-acetylglucosamine:LPS N-acetylglucosamine transferase